MQYDRKFEVFIMHKTYFDELQSKNFFKDYSTATKRLIRSKKRMIVALSKYCYCAKNDY